jgi:murein L,D-transpeptidase YcbB/YkuD
MSGVDMLIQSRVSNGLLLMLPVVTILYATVVVTEDGIVHFFDDIYGHDAALDKVLQKGYPYPG